ncbi:CHASE2 domain-containing protein [Calothrix sp. PCC 6303]|uniref:CHASE2 domain-containing protein n=1 Tax=Calothrix sp. PCC 6303 TaxID=1170562 RepID=UPI0002A041E0|nr:CHASE2 domain-containing protein [Calothrix sp. PCC 6303]AFZ03965.1 CHASE2 domain protein [Calothrix sp. PCC 6303]
MKHIFNLKVQKVEQICLFELSWGKGQRLTAQVDFPDDLTSLYQEWQRAYFYFYQSDQMRGKAIGGGVAKLTVTDWHAELVKAETKLMYEFHRWLRSAELFEIRSHIAQASQELVKVNPDTTEAVQLFLTCAPIEMDRFPWEAWELGTEFATTGAIQIIRAPLNIKAETGVSPGKPRQGRARILAILGDDTGLNFQADKEAVQSLIKIAEVQFVGWQPEQTPTQVIQQITDAIADERGWDVLFFAGHSNETEMTGGELGIAPGVSISIKEIASQLSAARKRGLQVAIFNSCSGLNIANSLIDLGFSQVVVMREPIHNRVAQEFLVRFLQGLAKYQGIYEAVMGARQFLRMEKSHTYPSSYLVPSLFCHPDAKLFRILPFGLRQRIRRSAPNFIEAIALTVSVALGVLPPFQEFLLDSRMYVQAAYRSVTTQIPNDKAPPVALIEIDTASIYRSQLPNSQIHPFSRTYISKLLDRLNTLNAGVVGLDFLFDTPQTNPASGDADLGKSVRRLVDKNTWLIFAALLEPDREVGTNEALGINKWNWTLQGYVDSYNYFLELPDPKRDCRQVCPISYLMALTQTARQEITDLPQPQTNRTTNLRTQLLDTIQQKKSQKGDLANLLNLKRPLGLEPLVDFSLPPQNVYTKIPAWQLMENPDINKFPLISKQVVLVAAGNDERLVIAPGQADRTSAPSATVFWTKQEWLTGGESLAYMTQHFLTRHLVIPIPDLWLIGLAAILGRITVFLLKKKSSIDPTYRTKIIAISTGVVVFYGLLGLQLYISAAVLLPWFLPSSVFLTYVLPITRRRNHV